MKTTRMNIAALTALTLLLGFGLVDEAEAKIRVKATLRTPNVGVVFDNGRSDCRIGRPLPLPDRHYRNVRISKRDKRIAKRLAYYTGVSKRELIQAKRMGYSWNEIGRWLDVPRRVVKAAKSARRWERFLRYERRMAKNRGHHRQDDWYYD
jgi:hypothetical protein